MLSSTSSENKLVGFALVCCAVIPTGLYMEQLHKPEYVEKYRPNKIERPANGEEVLINRSKFILHAVIKDNGNNYTNVVTDVETGNRYQVTGSLPPGEYWNVQIVDGAVKDSTRTRIKLSCEEASAMTTFLNVYDVSECKVGYTRLP